MPAPAMTAGRAADADRPADLPADVPQGPRTVVAPSAPESRATVTVEFAPGLRLFLKPRDRGGRITVAYDGTSSLGHVVEACGVPLPETGPLWVVAHAAARRAAPGAPGRTPAETVGSVMPVSYRPSDGDLVRVPAIERPQPLPVDPPRFLLDVHLGALARRLRLVGVDTAYRNDLDDDTLIEHANQDRRVLLTQDRGILRRRRLWLGAYVRGSDPDDQFVDVLDRFAPPLSPFNRCTACNGTLSAVARAQVEDALLPGTRRSYDAFARCELCGRVYWRGAHRHRLEALVTTAQEVVSGRRGRP